MPANLLSRALTFLACALLAASASAQLRPMTWNQNELVEISVQGEIAPPTLRQSIYRVEADGRVRMLPGIGGITYNFRTGDSAVRMAGNHVEPAVSIYNPGLENQRTSAENRALNALASIGNQAVVRSGRATGATGWVIGKHGGAEHVMVDFPASVYPDLSIGDIILVRAIGAGMELTNARGVKVMNASPKLMEALNTAGAGVDADGTLHIGVTHRVPAKIMGSGLGRDEVFTGDYDIQLFDPDIVREHQLDSLRFGDIVAIIDADHSFGRIYLAGAISVGVVVHGRSDSAGHGPGVATLFTSTEGNIRANIDPNANLARLLEIRELPRR